MMPNKKQVNSDDILLSYAEAVCRKIGHEYTIVKNVGDGNSASVYKISMGMVDRYAALKIYYPRFFQGNNRDLEQKRIMNQMSLKGHGHPNLIDFIRAGQIHDTYYLLMEYFPWKPLDKCLKTIDRSEIGAIISKIASAAELLEQRNFVHRDIKPANILVSKDCKGVKLLDLGVIRSITATNDQSVTDHGYALPFVATAQYSSPGYLFRDSPSTEEMWKALTFYQLGAVLHDLIMAEPIFAREIRSENRYRIAAAVLHTIPEVRATDVPPRLINLSRSCLQKEDSIRLKRISWSSFHDEDEGWNDQIRDSLGLGTVRAPTQVGLPDDQRQSERLQIRLNEAQDSLVVLSQHVLKDNGFPQAAAKKLNGTLPYTRYIALIFRPSNSVRDETNLMLVLRLSMLEQSSSQCEIALASILSKGESDIPGFDEGNLLWSSTLDDLKLEDSQMIEILSKEFLRHYAHADQQLVIFEDEACQLKTMVMEVT